MAQATLAYTTKAEQYARYRWDYAPDAVEQLFAWSGAGVGTVAADLGAGTGILTRHLAGRARRVLAIEPDPAMRLIAQRELLDRQNCLVIAATAEATGLAGQSIDLACAAQAVHWFDPSRTQRELRRILKPGGRLVIIWNNGLPRPVDAAMQAIMTPEFGVLPAHAAPAAEQPPEAYFAPGTFQRGRWVFQFEQDWEQFFGALCSASFTPEASHPTYPTFASAARDVFARHSRAGRLSGAGETHLIVGKIAGEQP